jgi:uncharacterized protein YicC (UPF0701 family)
MNPPSELAAWLACAAFVMMLANQAFRLKAHLLGDRHTQEIFPQPLEIKPVGDPVSRDYCDRNHEASTQRIETLEQALKEMREERRASAAKLEGQLRTVSRDIPELERRLNAATEARLEKVHVRINEVLGEVRELRGEINNL